MPAANGRDFSPDRCAGCARPTHDACPAHHAPAHTVIDPPQPCGDSDASAASGSSIPALAHFIWYGERFPWVNTLALRSAIERGGFERVVLHHSQPLSHQPLVRELLGSPSFEARPIAAGALLAPFGALGQRLTELHARLRSPAARANLLRAAILAQQGGVYLDMDTVTLASLAPLRAAALFCGEEHVAFPSAVLRGRRPAALARALGLHALRALCKHAPDGLALFRRIRHRYDRALNNAVLGATPGHPFLLELLARMDALSRARQQRRFALGTHLLQAVAARRAPAAELVVHPPEVFYPLGPEISSHWFRMRERAELAQVVSAQTRVVHWYASVENRTLCARIDPAYVRAHAQRQLFSALAVPFAAP